MQTNYRGRLFRFYAVNTPWLVRGVWSIAKNLVDEFTFTKMHLLSTDFKDEVHKFIDPSSLEQKYGGTLQDKLDKFFPPELK